MTDMKNDIENVIRSGANVQLSRDEIEFLNSMNKQVVAEKLNYMLRTVRDPTIEARAFDGLMHLANYDQICFLIEFFDENLDNTIRNDYRLIDWRIVCCRELAQFSDARAIYKLCSTLLNDNSPDVRFVAAESLAINGDKNVIDGLIYAKENDKGKDFEGFPIAHVAEKSLEKIQDRLEKKS